MVCVALRKMSLGKLKHIINRGKAIIIQTPDLSLIPLAYF